MIVKKLTETELSMPIVSLDTLFYHVHKKNQILNSVISSF